MSSEAMNEATHLKSELPGGGAGGLWVFKSHGCHTRDQGGNPESCLWFRQQKHFG